MHLLALLQECLHAAVLGQLGLRRSFLEGIKVLAVALHLLEILGIRGKLCAHIQVVQEGIALVTYIDKTSIQSRHELAHLAQIDIPHGEGHTLLLLLILCQTLVLGQGNGDFLWLNVNK